MQKIKDNFMQSLYRYNLSKLSLVTILDLINFADEQGVVQVYYKDIVELVGCSNAQFYNVLKELEDLGLISRRKNEAYKKEIEITLLLNNFAYEYKDYVNINNEFFTKRYYKKLKAGAIRVYLYVLFRVSKQKFADNNNNNKLFYSSSYKKIAKQLCATKRMIKEYCNILIKEKLISIGEKIDIKDKKYDIVTLNKEKTKATKITATERGTVQELKANPLHLHFCHYIKNLCRRHRKEYNEINLNDSAILMNQYNKKADQSNKNIYTILKNAILSLDNTLDSRALHRIIKNLINIDYSDNLIIY